MTVEKPMVPKQRLEPATMLICMLPDDGTDLKIMHQLRKEKGVTRAESVACRGVNNLQSAKTRLGRLPEPELFRILTVCVDESEADDIFCFIHANARIGEAGRGVLIQSTIIGATPYRMPDDVPEEEQVS